MGRNAFEHLLVPLKLVGLSHPELFRILLKLVDLYSLPGMPLESLALLARGNLCFWAP